MSMRMINLSAWVSIPMSEFLWWREIPMLIFSEDLVSLDLLACINETKLTFTRSFVSLLNLLFNLFFAIKLEYFIFA